MVGRSPASFSVPRASAAVSAGGVQWGGRLGGALTLVFASAAMISAVMSCGRKVGSAADAPPLTVERHASLSPQRVQVIPPRLGMTVPREVRGPCRVGSAAWPMTTTSVWTRGVVTVPGPRAALPLGDGPKELQEVRGPRRLVSAEPAPMTSSRERRSEPRAV